MSAFQQERPKWERDLPQYARDDLDRRRSDSLKNARDNPALMEILYAISDKLDKILAR